MQFNSVTNRPTITKVEILGTRCVVIVYSNGAEITATDISWNTIKNNNEHADSNSGTLVLNQKGSTGQALASIEVSIEKPLNLVNNLDDIDYSNITTLRDYLISNLL